jgi:hypothetical protein
MSEFDPNHLWDESEPQTLTRIECIDVMNRGSVATFRRGVASDARHTPLHVTFHH